MTIPTKQRWIVYLIALALTLAAVRWAGGEDRTKPGVPAASAAERANRPAGTATVAAAASAPQVELDRLEPRTRAQPASDLFQSLSWQSLAQDEARRNAPPPPPPPPPQAPPLPFTYMGKLIEGGKTVAFLTKDDRNYIVRSGDTLDGIYDVEKVDEGEAVLNYLPLGIRQTLSFAAPGGAPLADIGAVARAPALAPAPDDQDKDD